MGVRAEPYELHRYETILSHVPRDRFRHVFEPGCSIGELTVRLADRCGFVTAIDIAENAVETARRRCEHLDNVDVRHGALPDDLPRNTFDLVVFSEVGYYFDAPQLAELALAISAISQREEPPAVH
jgi:SAM-dependent methyltransferase